MPKLRMRIPVTVDVTPEELEALGSLGGLLGKIAQVAGAVRESGVAGAARQLARDVDAAAASRKRRRRSRD